MSAAERTLFDYVYILTFGLSGRARYFFACTIPGPRVRKQLRFSRTFCIIPIHPEF